MVLLKLFGSFLLLCCLIVGIKKADKKTHNTEHHAMAEYITGFIFAFGALYGFYLLWW
jgi:hypothetical protein